MLYLRDTFWAAIYVSLKIEEYLEKSIEIKRRLNDKIGISINYLNFGNLYFYRKDFDEAIRYYDYAVKLNPDLDKAYLGRGLVYIMIRVYDKALKDFSRVIDLKPNFAGAYEMRGTAFLGLNESDSDGFCGFQSLRPCVIASLRSSDLTQGRKGAKMGEMRPRFFFAYARELPLATTENVRTRNESDKALEDYNRAIELDPDSAEAYYNRGLHYYWLNRYEKLIKDFTIALELNPNDITIMTILSESYMIVILFRYEINHSFDS